MQVLNEIKKLLNFNGLWLADNERPLKRAINIFLNILIISSLHLYVWLSLYVLKDGYDNMDVNRMSYSLLQALMGLSTLAPYTLIIFQKRNISNMINTIQSVVDESIHKIL